MGNSHGNSSEKQSLKDKLMAIILLETSKSFKEMDSDLVSECVDFLMELEGTEKLSKAEIERRVSEIPFKGKVTAIGSYTKRKIMAKRLAVIAAILAVIFALFSIIAIASGNTYSELFRKMGESIFAMLDDGALEHENITIYKTNETKTYSSINELVEAEGIEILYPAWLPDNEKIIKVWYVVNDISERYILQSNNPNHSVEIFINCNLIDEVKSQCIEEQVGIFTVYYDDMEQYIQASFTYNDSTYLIKSNTKDNLFRIIENLEEIN